MKFLYHPAAPVRRERSCLACEVSLVAFPDERCPWCRRKSLVDGSIRSHYLSATFATIERDDPKKAMT